MAEESKKKNYKETLNLPRTDFPMRARLPEREPGFLKKWSDGDLYENILEERRSSGNRFILHDGPPYANGHIHVGHVFNKILKDITIKFHTMKGCYAPYVPGWDCHGLPVEHRLFQELDLTKHDIDQVEFRKKAYNYAMKYVKIQSEEFRRLGVFGNWEDPYLTLTNDYEADILFSLAELYEKGYVYKDLKPVNWCFSCETALAEAEVDYENKVSPSTFLKFSRSEDFKGKSVSFLVWTTTPWTLAANVAVSVHPEHEYSFVDVGEEVLVMASELVSELMKKFDIRQYSIAETIRGTDLAVGTDQLEHPFMERSSAVVTADYVTVKEGTGCVHTAPGHGQEDYLTGREYDLPIIMPVEDTGTFSDEAGEFEGVHVLKANKLILDKLRSLNKLVKVEDMEHSYPHCWRCKKPVIFRATEQWFMKIDHNSLRKKMLSSIEEDVEWVPSSGKERICSMVSNRPDWCISRQRLWGVPIPAFKCTDCGEKITSRAIMEKVAALTRSKGSNVWFSHPASAFLAEEDKCGNCSSDSLEKEADILDVWFDSGISHQAVLKARGSLSFPADLYLEGSDQHRGWFQAALITSMGMNAKAPYRKVLTHGFVVDSEGRKMSKSVGNVISPQEVMKTYGADILRLWVFSSDYEFDIKLSDEILQRLADGYRKIRNTFKFLLSNLYDFDPTSDMVAKKELTEMDRWLLSRVSDLFDKVTVYYENYQYHKAYRMIYDFCVFEMSSVYLDVSKDSLYTYHPEDKVRRSHQSALYSVLQVMVRLLAPVLSFTTEEVWGECPGLKDPESVHLALWPDKEDFPFLERDKHLDEKWDSLLNIRAEVLKVLESKRSEQVIGSSLEARLGFFAPQEEMKDFLKENIKLIKEIFKVSEVSVLDVKQEDMHRIEAKDLYVFVEKALGDKCQRCWNYCETVGANDDHPEICGRCRKVVLERRSNG